MTDQPGPVALVTGAGSGVGRATALALSHRGYTVALSGRRSPPLEQTAAACDGPTLVISGDLTDPAISHNIASILRARFGRLDLLVNNAGSAPLLPLGDASPDAIRAVFDVNTIAPITLLNALWPLLRDADKRGGTPARVINISSQATRDPFPGLGIYGCAKGGLDVLALAIRNEGDPSVLGFSIALGAVETDMLRAIVTPEQLPPDQTLTPAEVADVIVEIALGTSDARNGDSIDLAKAD